MPQIIFSNKKRFVVFEKVGFNMKKLISTFLDFYVIFFLLIKNGLELLVCTWEFFFQEMLAKLSIRKNFTSFHLISVFMEL